MSYAASRPPRSQFGLRGMDEANPTPGFRGLQGEGARRGDDPKRTLILTLAALGAGGAALYFFAGDNRIVEGAPQVFADVAQCVSSGLYPGGVCEVQWNEANKLHQQAAPDYATMTACEDKHGAGRCMRPAIPEDPERSTRYIPAMSGYFFGNTGAGPQRGVPLYRFASEGDNEFHVAELKPKTNDELNDRAFADGGEKPGSGTASRSLILIPSASALTGAVPRPAPAGAAPAGAAFTPSAAGSATGMGAPATPSPSPAAAAPASRGGFGASAHGAGSGG